jgi:Putative transposase
MLSYETSGFSLDASTKVQSWDRDGLERLIRYCARPCFASENLRWNGPWLIYRLSKPTHKGQTFVQLDPLEFLDRIAAFIPLPHRHRRHYHGVFAPNSPLRKKVVAFAQQRIGQAISPRVQEVVKKTKRISFDWASLIARIYEVNPLDCCICGKKIKISGFITHTAEINRILKGIGWSIKSHDFDPPYDIPNLDICQLTRDTVDGFPAMEVQVHYCDIEPDPPARENCSDPPHWENNSDPPHVEDSGDPPHWND